LSRQGEEERFEAFGEGLQAKMRAGFLALAEEYKDRFVVIDGADTPEAVAARVLGVVRSKLS